MAECELRQRKKEDDGEVNLQKDKEEIKSAEQDKVHIENKPDPVRFILVYSCWNSQFPNILINLII